MRMRMTHRCGRLVTVLVVTMAVVILSATAASAATQSAQGYTQKTPDAGCSYIDTRLTYTAGRVTLSTYGSLDWYNGIKPCGFGGSAPAGWMYVIQMLFVQRQGRMVLCNLGPYIYNTAPPEGYSRQVTTSFTWPSAPCGPGPYAAAGGSFHYESARGWVGGWKWTRVINIR